jgi:hypothetical protein
MLRLYDVGLILMWFQSQLGNDTGGPSSLFRRIDFCRQGLKGENGDFKNRLFFLLAMRRGVAHPPTRSLEVYAESQHFCWRFQKKYRIFAIEYF